MFDQLKLLKNPTKMQIENLKNDDFEKKKDKLLKKKFKNIDEYLKTENKIEPLSDMLRKGYMDGYEDIDTDDANDTDDVNDIDICIEYIYTINFKTGKFVVESLDFEDEKYVQFYKRSLQKIIDNDYDHSYFTIDDE